ncbi:hypothetical protein JL49_08180 [Pseudoalteromonas luteoviolacea]|nr:hypothetical protein JL49_08180 [Pseudoalteromonas luteoviolacea]
MKPTEIKQAISNKGYTLSMIADAMSVKPSAISSVVNGTGRSKRIAQAISKIIDKPIESIFPNVSSYTQPAEIAKGEKRKQCVTELRQMLLAAS